MDKLPLDRVRELAVANGMIPIALAARDLPDVDAEEFARVIPG